MFKHPRSFPPIASCPICSRNEEHPCWLGRGNYYYYYYYFKIL